MIFLLHLVIHHAPTLAMFGIAWVSGRSLGAWPVYIGAIVTLVAVQYWKYFQAVDSAAILGSCLDMMLVPSLLFVMARLQGISGLRRGQMTEVDRMRWIARHGLAAAGGRRKAEQRRASASGSNRRPATPAIFHPIG